MARLLIATFALATAFLLTPLGNPTPANAVTVNISIGNGTSLNFGRGISCTDGVRLIRDRGFREVVPRDCRGRYFVYRASRGRHRYEISISSRNGRVADFRRMGRR
jgi:hypothetical protein